MAHVIEWDQQKTSWKQGNFDRPAKPVGFQREVFERFMDTNYCRITTLRAFLESHHHAWDNGVLNALHRRHIVSWDFMKKIVLTLANHGPYGRYEHFSDEMVTHEAINDLLQFLHPDAPAMARQAQVLPNNPYQTKQLRFDNLAKLICWSSNNVFIGTAQGNVGTEIDLGEDDDATRRDLLQGTPHQGIASAYAVVLGWMSHYMQM